MPYRTVDERHRVLTAIEDLWDRYPASPLMALLGKVTDAEVVEDDKLVRMINRKLSE